MPEGKYAPSAAPVNGEANGDAKPAKRFSDPNIYNTKGTPAERASSSAAEEEPPPPPPEHDFLLIGERLTRAELEACLTAIGMVKGPLALARSAFDSIEADAESSYDVSEWWLALNPRSRVVLQSKMRSCTGKPHVLFALALAVTEITGTAKQPADAIAIADLKETLGGIEGDEPLDVDKLLAGCEGEMVELAAWLKGLEEADKKLLSSGLIDTDVPPPVSGDPLSPLSSDGFGGPRKSARASFSPGELPLEMQQALAKELTAASDAMGFKPTEEPVPEAEAEEYEEPQVDGARVSILGAAVDHLAED